MSNNNEQDYTNCKTATKNRVYDKKYIKHGIYLRGKLWEST